MGIARGQDWRGLSEHLTRTTTDLANPSCFFKFHFKFDILNNSKQLRKFQLCSINTAVFSSVICFIALYLNLMVCFVNLIRVFLNAYLALKVDNNS